MELASRPTSLSNNKRVGLAAGALEKARIFDGRGEAAGEQDENFLLLVREVIDLRALDIEHADDLVLKDQRHGQLGAHRIDGVDVARILAHVGNANRFARGRRHTRQCPARSESASCRSLRGCSRWQNDRKASATAGPAA